VLFKTAILSCLIALISIEKSWGQSEFSMPEDYTVHKAIDKLEIDGKEDELSWQKTRWTNLFVDIEGDLKSKPSLNTRMKMLWDDEYFYFFAKMEEPHVWATLTERDAVIFKDNDFEIFIDPDGDTHNYAELEINALNTVWDLILNRPYRDGGHAINSWDIKGLKTAVHIDGTINDPSDTDKGWSVEIAIPWSSLAGITKTAVPPKNGSQWRLNFSRVQWQTEVVKGNYVKKKDSITGKDLHEDNWVWTPQRVIAMHEPEFWGIVSFTEIIVGQSNVSVAIDYGSEQVRRLLYIIHRNQRVYKSLNGEFSTDGKQLLDGQVYFEDGRSIIELVLTASKTSYQATIKRISSSNKFLNINETGRIWSETKFN